MSFDRPHKEELISAVREFLQDKLMPELSGHLKFNTLVAINVLKIVERELDLGPEIIAEESVRLRALLSENQSGTGELEQILCDQIDAGNFSYADEKLLETLWQTTMAKLSVDNPKYAAYQDELNKK